MAPPRPARRLPRGLTLAVAAALPWTWFVVRDSRNLLDVAATGLPVGAAGLTVAALLGAALFRRTAPAVFALSVAAVGATAVVGPWLPAAGPAPSRPFRVAVANTLHDNPTVPRAAADIRAQDPDVAVVVEGALGVYEELRDDFPVAALSTGAEHVVFSRFPVRLLGPPPGPDFGTRLARWQVAAPSGPVIVYSVHLGRPRVRETRSIRSDLFHQRQSVAALLDAVATETLPTLVVGDFNLSDRAWGYRHLTGRLQDAARADRAGPTFVRIRYRPFLLRIDHLFVPADWCSRDAGRFVVTGSDHRGVTAVVGPCP